METPHFHKFIDILQTYAPTHTAPYHYSKVVYMSANCADPTIGILILKIINQNSSHIFYEVQHGKKLSNLSQTFM